MTLDSPQTPERKIRSFVRREGRLTPAQQRALDKLWPVLGIEYQNTPLNLNALFGNAADVTLEIGFGMGGSLLEMAKAAPNVNFLGIEVHRPGLGALLNALEKENIKNVRLMMHDAVEVLTHCIEDEALSRINIFFPDPWPKKRHHKRRLIQPDFVLLLAKKLKKDGILHLATDWENYAEHMIEVLGNCNEFKIIKNQTTLSEQKSLRPETKFEKRGKNLGHGVWDLLFIKKHGA